MINFENKGAGKDIEIGYLHFLTELWQMADVAVPEEQFLLYNYSYHDPSEDHMTHVAITYK